MLRRVVRSTAVGVALTWLIGGVLLVVGQERLIFPSPAVDAAVVEELVLAKDGRTFDLATSDDTRIRAWVAGEDRHDRLLLFFHGNGGTLFDAGELHDRLGARGWAVLTVTWRGYPGSDGAPGQAGLELDAEAAWNHATTTLGFPSDRIAVHGYSLGGALALWVASRHEPGAVVLESTFRSMVAMAQRRAPVYPVRWLLRHPFESERLAPHVTVPAFVLHSRDDGLIPVEHGRALARALPSSTFVEVEGYGHGGFPSMRDETVFSTLTAFLDEVIPPR